MTKGNHIPASIRIPNKDFDSCLSHIDYNIDKLSKMQNNKENTHPYEVLNCIDSIITNICKLVEKPTRGHENDTLCISTRLESCHQEDIQDLKSKLQNIRTNDIYKILKDARNHTVAHIHSKYEEYGATQKALLAATNHLFEDEDRLKQLVEQVRTLIHFVEVSVRKKEGKPINSVDFTLHIIKPPDK